MKVSVDKIGAVASTVCAVHCVLTGLALGLLSFLGLGFVGSGWTELGFVLLAVTLGLAALVHGVRRHHSYVPAILFALAMVSLLVSHFVFGHQHGANGQWSVGATVTSVVGGSLLVAFHILNIRMANHCDCRQCKGR